MISSLRRNKILAMGASRKACIRMVERICRGRCQLLPMVRPGRRKAQLRMMRVMTP
jgi:hypothetical protein